MNPLIHALATVSGWNAPQNALGLGMLGFDMLRHPSAISSLHAGPGGTIAYTDPTLSTPAATLGNIIALSKGSENDPDVLKHELRHVDQSDLLGPLTLPEAAGETDYDYGSGALERDAIAHATPQSEMLRPGSSLNKGAANPILQALIGKILGK